MGDIRVRVKCIKQWGTIFLEDEIYTGEVDSITSDLIVYEKDDDNVNFEYSHKFEVKEALIYFKVVE